ncbi:type II toxin-antitoxin system RelE/ParE family toxin [Roseomonas sp. F4]
MKRLEFTRAARQDLFELQDQIIAEGGEARALAYLDRLMRRCATLEVFPEAGRPRGTHGTRSLAFERRVVMIYRLRGEAVRILRVLYGGRDLPW